MFRSRHYERLNIVSAKSKTMKAWMKGRISKDDIEVVIAAW